MTLIELLTFYEKDYITPLVDSTNFPENQKNEFRLQIYSQIIKKMMSEIDASLPRNQADKVVSEIEKQSLLEKKLEIFHQLIDSSPQAQKAIIHFSEYTLPQLLDQITKDYLATATPDQKAKFQQLKDVHKIDPSTAGKFA